MTTDVLTLRPQTALKVAAAALVERNVASAPVVDDHGRLVGIVSELDLLAHDVPPDPLARMNPPTPDTAPLPTAVQDVMTREVITLPPTADAALFLRHMLLDRVVCIPVTEDDRLVGVVSRRDLLRLFARADADIGADVDAAVADALSGERWHAVVRDGVVTLAPAGPAAARPAAARPAAARPAAARPSAQRDVARRVAQSVPGVVRVLVEDPAAPEDG
jgi:CBS domain-containing protein